MQRKNWTRDEFILAFNLYLKLPFGQMSATNKEIIALAKLMGRTSSAVAMRLVNFASVDPFHQNRGIKGLTGGIKQCKPIFDEFINDRETLMFESEEILAKYQGTTIENKFSEELIDIFDYTGQTKQQLVKIRVNQTLFRKIVLSAYSNTCAISGISTQELLIASHIIPWADDETNRLNPSNGLCLNAIHDKAFDRGLITIMPDYTIKISERIMKEKNNPFLEENFKKIDGKSINLPQKFLPNPDFLNYHNQHIFK